MSVRSLFGLGVVACVVGCDTGAKEAEVPGGEFVLSFIEDTSAGSVDVVPFGELHILIGRDAAQLTVELPDGTTQVADLLLRDPDEWQADCYTNYNHALTEVYDVDTDSLNLGAATVEMPVLSAKCGGRPMLGADGGDETFSGPVYYFDEL